MRHLRFFIKRPSRNLEYVSFTEWSASGQRTWHEEGEYGFVCSIYCTRFCLAVIIPLVLVLVVVSRLNK